MEEIQVGEYVRTNYGIKRIDIIFENRPINRYGYEIGSDWDGKEYSIIKTTEIVKHSKNIIDLIEETDFVNGQKVVEKKNPQKCNSILLSDGSRAEEQDIQTILTKEQYQINCFRIGE